MYSVKPVFFPLYFCVMHCSSTQDVCIKLTWWEKTEMRFESFVICSTHFLKATSVPGCGLAEAVRAHSGTRRQSDDAARVSCWTTTIQVTCTPPQSCLDTTWTMSTSVAPQSRAALVEALTPHGGTLQQLLYSFHSPVFAPPACLVHSNAVISFPWRVF